MPNGLRISRGEEELVLTSRIAFFYRRRLYARVKWLASNFQHSSLWQRTEALSCTPALDEHVNCQCRIKTSKYTEQTSVQ
jgi:hypothetical protein